jgi:hypothetical protein
MEPIVAAHRRRVGAHRPDAGALARAGAWIALAIGLSAALVALVAVMAITAAIGFVSADLAVPTEPFGSLASTITDLPLRLG